jgi:hypothetical protein
MARKEHGLSVVNRFGAYLHRGVYNTVEILGELYFPVDEKINSRDGLSVSVFITVEKK